MAPRIHARFATDTEVRLWDRKVLQNPHGRRAALPVEADDPHDGWRTRHLVYEGQGSLGRLRSYALVLQKSVPVLGDLWCLPQGPDLHAVQDMNAVIEAHQNLVEREGLKVFAIRMVPETAQDAYERQYLRCLGLQAGTAGGSTTDAHPGKVRARPDADQSFDQVLRPTAYLAWNRWLRARPVPAPWTPGRKDRPVRRGAGTLRRRGTWG